MKNEETLLELVDSCPVTVVKESSPDKNGEAKLLRVKELREMGFTQLAKERKVSFIVVKSDGVVMYGVKGESDE